MSENFTVEYKVGKKLVRYYGLPEGEKRAEVTRIYKRNGEVVIKSGSKRYEFAALTVLTSGDETLSFHGTRQAAEKGNPSFTSNQKSSVRVFPIEEENPGFWVRHLS